jgi:hypothetical protein
MKIITFNDEAAPWSRNNHLMGIKLLSSSDDSNNNCFEIPHRTRTWMIVINKATFCLGLLKYAYLCSLPQFFRLFKPKVLLCTLEMG